DDASERLVPVLRCLRRLQQEPKADALRGQALALLARQSGQTFSVKENGTKPEALKQAYQPVFDWFEKRHPALVKALHGADDEDPAYWDQLLRSVDWAKGDAARGATLFRTRACLACHSGGRPLGPDLSGVTGRFSREDLFTAIIWPHRDV